MFRHFLHPVRAGREEIKVIKMVKDKIVTVICTLMVFFPWTILPLRTYDWALESPVAEIMICSYAAVMILGGIFTILFYAKAKVRNSLMKICVIVNGLYAAGGVAAFGMLMNTLE